MVVVSCYFSPNAPIREYEEWLTILEEAIRGLSHETLIVAGDFNAKNSAWGAEATDKKGQLLADMFAVSGLEVVN